MKRNELSYLLNSVLGGLGRAQYAANFAILGTFFPGDSSTVFPRLSPKWTSLLFKMTRGKIFISEFKIEAEEKFNSSEYLRGVVYHRASESRMLLHEFLGWWFPSPSAVWKRRDVNLLGGNSREAPRSLLQVWCVYVCGVVVGMGGGGNKIMLLSMWSGLRSHTLMLSKSVASNAEPVSLNIFKVGFTFRLAIGIYFKLR